MDVEYDLDLAVGLLALLVAAYGMLAVQLARWSVSAAFAILVIGAIIGGSAAGIVIGDLPSPDMLSILAEVTLALVLFSAASTIRLERLEVDSPVVLRLLAIGLRSPSLSAPPWPSACSPASRWAWHCSSAPPSHRPMLT